MIGRRRDGKPSHELLPGEYKLTDSGELVFCDPRGNVGRARPPMWKITVHADRTITVSPSLFVNQGKPNAWHGFLERGIWRPA